MHLKLKKKYCYIFIYENVFLKVLKVAALSVFWDKLQEQQAENYFSRWQFYYGRLVVVLRLSICFSGNR